MKRFEHYTNNENGNMVAAMKLADIDLRIASEWFDVSKIDPGDYVINFGNGNSTFIKQTEFESTYTKTHI